MRWARSKAAGFYPSRLSSLLDRFSKGIAQFFRQAGVATLDEGLSASGLLALISLVRFHLSQAREEASPQDQQLLNETSLVKVESCPSSLPSNSWALR